MREWNAVSDQALKTSSLTLTTPDQVDFHLAKLPNCLAGWHEDEKCHISVAAIAVAQLEQLLSGPGPDLRASPNPTLSLTPGTSSTHTTQNAHRHAGRRTTSSVGLWSS